MKKIQKIPVALLISLFTSTTQAAITIYKPTTIFSNDITVDAGNLTNTINSSGLFDATNTTTATRTTLDTGATLSTALSTYHEFDGAGHAQSFRGSTATSGNYPSIVFDLGSDQTIGGVLTWVYGNSGGAIQDSMRDFELQFNTSADGGVTFSGAASAFTATSEPGTKVILGVDPNDQGTQAPEYFTFGSVDARYIKLTFKSSIHDTNLSDGGRVGLGEIRFASVPEPSSTALLGLGAFAMILRRRK